MILIWRRCLLLLLVYFPLLGLTSASSSSNRDGGGGSVHPPLSPVRELGPSLAASVAGGTVVAARSVPRTRQAALSPGSWVAVPGDDDDDDGDGNGDGGECVVVLLRSPIAGGSRSGPGTGTQVSGPGGATAAGNDLTVASVFESRADDDNPRLSFLPAGPVRIPSPPGDGDGGNLRVLHAPSGLLAAATGFAPDADHLLNVAAGRVLSRASMYGAAHGGRGFDPHRLVREDLSPAMVDAAAPDGGRPLGVQLLVVGRSSAPSSRRGAGGRSLEVYTVDPSGGWRSHVGGVAAVGRGAERVDARLSHPAVGGGSSQDASAADGWRGALDRALIASIDALERYDEPNDLERTRNYSRANYGAVVVFGRCRGGKQWASASQCAEVAPALVEERYNTCRQKLMASKVDE